MIYSRVTVQKPLAYLHKVCVGLHEINAFNNVPEMLMLYANANVIPQYINMLEDPRKRFTRAGLTIDDANVVAIARCLL